jgi:hypothetical protein
MAQRPKAKPKPRGQRNTDAKQFERFKETARELDVDQSGELSSGHSRKSFQASIAHQPISAPNSLRNSSNSSNTA